MTNDTGPPNIFETNPELREFILSGLTDALVHPDPEARRIAALNLGRVRDEAFRAVPTLYRMLTDDPAPELRHLAASVLAGLGARTLPFLFRALVSNSPDTLDAARRVLNAHTIPRQDFVPTLIQVASDQDPFYRYQAMTALFYALDGRIDREYVYFDDNSGQRAFETFHRALIDSDEMVRLVSAYALWIVYRDTSGVKLIESASQSPDSPNSEMASKMAEAIRLGMEND